MSIASNLFKDSSLGVIMLKEDGTITYANPRAFKFFRVSAKKDFINKSLFKLDLFKDSEVSKEIRKGLKKGSFTSNEITLKFDNSEEFIAKYNGIRFGDCKTSKEFVVFVEDVTEIVKSQKEIKSSEKKFRLLAEESPNMVFIIQDDKVVYANKKTEEITGYDKDHFYSAKFNINTLIASSNKEALNPLSSLSMNNKLEMTPEARPYEYELTTKEGKKKWVLMSFNIIQYEGKTATMGIITDITERKKIENKINRANEELRKIDKLKDELINVVAHELKTPLIPIMGYANLILKDKEPLNKGTKQQLEIILRNAKRLEQLIKNILEMSRIDSGAMKLNLEKVDISALANEVFEAMTPIAEQAKLKFTKKVSKVPAIKADSDKIYRVITNLVSNSLKYTEKGSVTLIVKKEGNNIAIIVKDTGMGIKDNDKEKLFKKFSQLNYNPSRSEKGTGLGLAICKGIIDRHKGEILVESIYGEGSEFKVLLPIKKKGLNKQ